MPRWSAHSSGCPGARASALAFLAGGDCGALPKRIIVRRLYQRPLDAILATWGLGIVIGQLVTLAFGREVQFVQAPITGTVACLGRGLFRLSPCHGRRRLIVSPSSSPACSTARGSGLSTRAVIMNEMLAQGLGIDSARVRLITFAIGSGLAALAGALITPLSSVDPNMGLPWLISAFMLVMVSGGSLLTLARVLLRARRTAR